MLIARQCRVDASQLLPILLLHDGWITFTFFVLFFAKFDTNRIRTRVMNNNIINIDVKIMFLFFYNFKKISAK